VESAHITNGGTLYDNNDVTLSYDYALDPSIVSFDASIIYKSIPIFSSSHPLSNYANVSTNFKYTNSVDDIDLHKPGPIEINFGALYNWHAASLSDFTIEYGVLYNGYTAIDARNIANIGWSVPTHAQLSTLGTYLGPSSVQIVESGTTHWINSYGTNAYEFNLRGAGYRSTGFSSLKSLTYLLSSTTVAPLPPSPISSIRVINISGTISFMPFISNTLNLQYAGSIRLVKDSTSLTHGQKGTYTGNDGKVYRTICVGTQEWLADNLCETKFRNGDTIDGFDTTYTNTQWQNLTSSAMCHYNNVASNSYTLIRIAKEGWRVPTIDELLELTGPITIFSPEWSTSGGAENLKSTTQWPTNPGNDSSSFHAKPAGFRKPDGSYIQAYNSVVYWSSSLWSPGYPLGINIRDTDNNSYEIQAPSAYGCSVRLLKDGSTTLTNGQSGTYTGSDGRVYDTICIGNQEWLAENLMETLYTNGSPIPLITTDASWAADASGAMSYYNNDIINAIAPVPVRSIDASFSYPSVTFASAIFLKPISVGLAH
jgi:uncharacterized protein (TIGR02145 family)